MVEVARWRSIFSHDVVRTLCFRPFELIISRLFLITCSLLYLLSPPLCIILMSYFCKSSNNHLQAWPRPCREHRTGRTNYRLGTKFKISSTRPNNVLMKFKARICWSAQSPNSAVSCASFPYVLPRLTSSKQYGSELQGHCKAPAVHIYERLRGGSKHDTSFFVELASQ